ncbi:sodium:phosphate symporter [Halegenticoccus tardaugens]|uniref:sodium:phosphate symporter n=1 Tax=Halegenticoccus tardaugens TaxID=2071624 RepID=UPI00100A7C88|nr:sodium:phosphate symporter [Halegenticoccus tardaugens]
MTSGDASDASPRRLPTAVRAFAGLVAVAVFLFAVQLLGAATPVLAPDLASTLRIVTRSPASALGTSWLAAYAMLNGSVVAALALSLFGAGLVTPEQLFLMIAGSRLGAAGIVLVIGGLDSVGRRQPLRRATGLGVLTVLVSYTIYLPATVAGFAVFSRFRITSDGSGGAPVADPGLLSFFAPAAGALTDVLGGPAAFVLALALLFGSLKLFGRTVAGLDRRRLRDRYVRHLRKRWLSFGVGLALTGFTTSIAFSVGVVVPLYNRGYVDRDEMVPYVMGASVGTVTDTLLVALLLDTPAGIRAVLVLGGAAAAVATLFLANHDRYATAVGIPYDRLVSDGRTFAAFLALLVLVPLFLALL